jgi:hypothetical protein
MHRMVPNYQVCKYSWVFLFTGEYLGSSKLIYKSISQFPDMADLIFAC